MNTRLQEITRGYIGRQIEAIRTAANKTLDSIRHQRDGLKFIFDSKFDQIGYNPLETNKGNNLLEQINQSMTLLTTYWILDQHRGRYFRAHLGEKNGTDLEVFESEKENSLKYIFEIFAATNPYQNKKLLKDIKTVVNRSACPGAERSVCFCSPNPFKTSVKKYYDIQIDWGKEINPEEKEKYNCTVQEKQIGIIWIKNETLFSWAVDYK